MKKTKKQNIKVPKYAIGAIIAAAADMGDKLGQSISASGNQDLGTIVSSGFNPLSSAGQVLGDRDSSFGEKVGSFLPVAGGFIANSVRKRREIRERSQRESSVATQQQTNNLVNEHYGKYGDVYAFADGGFLPSNLAYVDNDEIIRDVNGNIGQVPDTTNGTDQHLIETSSLESVLSDKLKKPGTNKTFAELGSKLTTTPSKGKDRFAEATNRLNQMNANRAYNNLLLEQENYKAKKGIKPKSKDLPAYQLGGTMLPEILSLATSVNKPIAGVKAPAAKKPDLSPISGKVGTNASYNKQVVDPKVDAVSGKDRLSNIAGTLGSLSPVISNMLSGLSRAEVEQAIANPYGSQINRLMASRRMNIDPIMEANRTTRAINNYNLSRINPNTGMNLAARTQMATDEYRNNANLYASQQNANNQYSAEYAQMLSGLGRDYATSQQYTNDINAQNRAMKRNYLNTAASQFGQWSQVQQQMANQRKSDAMVAPALLNYLNQGFDSNVMSQINAAMAQYRR